ncbi:MAG TPA: hypothetical protein VNN25_10760 [Thermoanaerobaculia bacterium]|nr:hypothetical protein [Thermoanaerobaculia bacterium]
MNNSTYIDGAEVHAGDRVAHGGVPATVVLVAERNEAVAEFALAEWAEQGNILIR